MDKRFLLVLILALSAVVVSSGCIQPPVCGNGTCEFGEDAVNCPRDCSIAVCGDAVCDPPETFASCPQDCATVSRGSILVTVSDGTTGEMIAGASVKITSGNYTQTRDTNASGAYWFKRLNPGLYTVEVSKEGYETAMPQAFELRTGETREMEVVLGEQAGECTTATYYEGDIIAGLQGRNAYEGQELTVKLAAVTQTSSTSPYNAKFEVYTETGDKIDYQYVPSGTNLRDVFVDETGDYVLETRVLVESIGVEPTTSKGFAVIEVCRGATEFEEIAIGNNKVKYTDKAGVEREIPFYIKLDNTEQIATFTFNNQTFYYRCRHNDTVIEVQDDDLLNGYEIERDIYTVQTDEGPVDLRELTGGDSLYLGGVQFDFMGHTADTISLQADGFCQYSSQPFADPYYLRIGGVAPLNNSVYYDDDDATRGPVAQPLNVTNDTMEETYNYRMYVAQPGNDQDAYLVLDAHPYLEQIVGGQGLDAWKTQGGAQVLFVGTDLDENPNNDVTADYYKPDTSDFGEDTGDSSYLIAWVYIAEDGEQASIVPIIDTATGDTVVLPNDQLSYYEGCVYYRVDGTMEILKCRTDIPGSFSATTSYGSEISVSEGVATIRVPVQGGSSGGGGGVEATSAITWG